MRERIRPALRPLVVARAVPPSAGVRIAEAALRLAVRDLERGERLRRGAPVVARDGFEPDDAASAERWLQGAPAREGFSFTEACHVLGLDPGATRRAIERRLEKQQEPATKRPA